MYIDNIKDIISLFNEEDNKEFRAFINRQRQRKNRKDLELFEILSEAHSYPAKEIVKRLYNNDNMNAYHSVRKRLLRHLMDFVVIKRIDEDTTEASSISGMLTLSKFLFENGNDRVGWVYLKKSEQLALSSEQFELLNNVLNSQIEFANSEFAPRFEEIISKREKNKKLADEDERANIATAIVRLKLKEYITNGADVNINHEVTKAMYDYNLYNAAKERPRILYNLLTIVRSAILAKKEYYKFEPLVIESYKQVLSRYGFKKKDHFYKLSILYMIVHILYRTKKFDEALRYLSEMEQELEKYKKSYFIIYYPRYIMLYAATKNLMGDVDESIRITEHALNLNDVQFSDENRLQMTINLAVYYFEKGDFKESNKVIHSIEHTDKWCEKKMGKEWVLRKNLGEVIVLYERGNLDLAFDRIRAIEKQNSVLFKQPIYKRVTTFLNFIKVCIDKPYWVGTQEFYDKVNSNIEHWPVDQEDILASAFYCWLKSKMLKKDFYLVLVETLKGTM